MLLSPKTKVEELIKTYPFMEKFLPAYNSHFEKLFNPKARATIGKIATLQMAAINASLDINVFISDLKQAIKDKTGEDIGVLSPKDIGKRAKRIKQILADLHASDGKNVEEMQKRFAEEIKDVSPTEIADIERQMIADGVSEAEITSMCDLHVAVFRQSLDEQDTPDMQPGHPVHTFRAENREFEKLARRFSLLTRDADEKSLNEHINDIKDLLNALAKIDIHYTRKENQLFPYLEKHDVHGPPQVMWTIHDQVRDHIKALRTALDNANFAELTERAPKLIGAVLDMIYKEEQILYPMALEKLSEEEWVEIRNGESEIGYALVSPGNEWKPETDKKQKLVLDANQGEEIMDLKDLPDTLTKNIRLPLDVGKLTLEQINIMLKHLPIDISFVDENDELRYYSGTAERIFPRSPGVIGRKVQNCHPPKSVHIVEKILAAFKAGEKDTAEFWIEIGGKFIHIRYFAMRDKEGNYKGTLEVSQDVSSIRKLEGQNRLLDWE